MKTSIGILYTFNGLSMLIVWPILILKNQAPEIKTNLVYMSFHLISEFITASSCLLTGVGLILNKQWAEKNYYVTTGFFIGAGYLAIGYYLFSNLSTALPVLLMLIGLNIAGLILFIGEMRKKMITKWLNKNKFSHFFRGIAIYTLINIAGFLSEMNSGYTYGYVSMIIILIIYITWTLLFDYKSGFKYEPKL
jgi:hypothetical protein